jgi:hypothetical protein
MEMRLKLRGRVSAKPALDPVRGRGTLRDADPDYVIPAKLARAQAGGGNPRMAMPCL